MANEVITVKWLQGGRFIDKELPAKNSEGYDYTVGNLRSDNDIASNASIAIGGVDVDNSRILADGDRIAVVVSNKTGG
tara:strand:+ start:3654 stop:3887 length:234 start_codon:yes stop_codon:yes gene_type:complete